MNDNGTPGKGFSKNSSLRHWLINYYVISYTDQYNHIFPSVSVNDKKSCSSRILGNIIVDRSLGYERTNACKYGFVFS